MYETTFKTIIAKDYAHELTICHFGNQIPKNKWRIPALEISVTTTKIPCNIQNFFDCLFHKTIPQYVPLQFDE